ncbi:diguanylate cyclase domain-containing protein [Kitasatospora sp. NPDC088346]|uniref:diguanylate cyclase domain-containing protein n=1 Tax=Kitasatospora sp. NPDC088346 TaxID=3364073 RepID=UPI0038081CE4
MSTPLLVQALAPIGAAALATAGWCAVKLRRTTTETAAREDGLRQRVAELEQECAELQRTAACDPLTGVWNYRHLQLTLDKEIERSRRAEQTEGHRRPLALLMLEIAGFETVVAEHGRGRGNAILRDLVQRLSIEIRRSDTLGRYGGEEFLILLPDTGAGGAVQVAERLCWAVRRHQLLDWSPAGPAPRRPAGGNGLSAAIGIAVLPRDGGHAALLLRAADRALGEARHAGGDCWRDGVPRPAVECARPAEPAPTAGGRPDRTDSPARTGSPDRTGRSDGSDGPDGEVAHEAPGAEQAAGGPPAPADDGGTPAVDTAVAQPPRSHHLTVPEAAVAPGSVSTCAGRAPRTSAGTSLATAEGPARDTVS